MGILEARALAPSDTDPPFWSSMPFNWKPIRRLDDRAGFMSSRMASKTTLNRASYLRFEIAFLRSQRIDLIICEPKHEVVWKATDLLVESVSRNLVELG